jgi:hypothetical protein
LYKLRIIHGAIVQNIRLSLAHVCNQQIKQEQVMKTIAISAALILLIIGSVAAYQHHNKAPELSDNIEEWTTEQLEDQTFEYIDAIETIKDEQRRRERLAARTR